MEHVRGPVLGVGAIVTRTSNGVLEVLLVKRRYEPYRGYWSFAGGHVEPGEPILEAAKRELREETGIIAEPVGVIHVHEMVAEKSGERVHYVILDVLFRYVGGEPRAASDAEEAAFIPLREAFKLNLTPGTRVVLSLLEKLLEKGCIIEPTRTM